MKIEDRLLNDFMDRKIKVMFEPLSQARRIELFGRSKPESYYYIESRKIIKYSKWNK